MNVLMTILQNFEKTVLSKNVIELYFLYLSRFLKVLENWQSIIKTSLHGQSKKNIQTSII